MLEVSNLMVFYENALALNDFSMRVEAGSIVAVIGSNSAGKTTLMNTVSGLIIDTQIKEQRKGGERITIYGTVKFDGEDITDLYPSERVKRGMVLCRERHPIFQESDLVENLKIAGYLRKRSEVTAAIRLRVSAFPHVDTPQEAKSRISERR